MTGYSVANEASGDLRADLPLALQKAEYRDFPAGAAPSFAFPPAAKIRFIHFNLATENHVGFLFEVVNADLTQVVKIVGRGIAVNANQGGRVTGRRAGHKMLQ
jgi:hypothetical protein